jgi:hypothetical protein
VSYNSSAVKIYNTTSTLVRFSRKKNIFSAILKNDLAYYNSGVVIAYSEVVGLGFGL